jgi:hypothetical protein
MESACSVFAFLSHRFPLPLSFHWCWMLMSQSNCACVCLRFWPPPDYCVSFVGNCKISKNPNGNEMEELRFECKAWNSMSVWIGSSSKSVIGRQDRLPYFILFMMLKKRIPWYIPNPRKLKAHFHMTWSPDVYVMTQCYNMSPCKLEVMMSWHPD